MAYNENIPQPTDQLKNSQNQLLENFLALQALLDVNHELGTFDSPVVGDTGKHKFVNLTNQTAVGDAAAAANEMTIFERVPATVAISAVQQVFVVRDSVGPANARYIPLTAGTNIINDGLPVVGGNDTIGYVFLGTGLCMKFGNLRVGAVANNTDDPFNININAIGPAYLTGNPPNGLFHAVVSLATDADIGLAGVGTAIVYVRWDLSTNATLVIRVRNRSGAALSANTRVYFTTIGQVDLTTT